MGNYLETIKNITKDKKKENLIYLLILCVVLFISISYIFSDTQNKRYTNINDENTMDYGNSIGYSNEKKDAKNDDFSNNVSMNDNINNDIMEEKLAKILSEISGIKDVLVMITYSSSSQSTPVYNTKEEEKEGNKIIDKEVVYNEIGSDKKVVIESIKAPIVEGVIIVAAGANNVEIRSKIAGAVSAITNVPVYKVQVFERKS